MQKSAGTALRVGPLQRLPLPLLLVLAVTRGRRPNPYIERRFVVDLSSGGLRWNGMPGRLSMRITAREIPPLPSYRKDTRMIATSASVALMACFPISWKSMQTSPLVPLQRMSRASSRRCRLSSMPHHPLRPEQAAKGWNGLPWN